MKNHKIIASMTNSQKIRELRNKAIPPVLEFGCEVECDTGIGRIVRGSRIIDWVESSEPIRLHTEKEMLDYENLGKPVSYQDVLRMIDNHHSIDIRSSSTQKKRWIVIEDDLWLDLTKSIEEQDDDVLEKLIKILE